LSVAEFFLAGLSHFSLDSVYFLIESFTIRKRRQLFVSFPHCLRACRDPPRIQGSGDDPDGAIAEKIEAF
jgi:hypothetical protein